MDRVREYAVLLPLKPPTVEEVIPDFTYVLSSSGIRVVRMQNE